MSRRTLATTLSAALVLAGTVTAAAAPGDSDPPAASVEANLAAEETALVRLQLPDRQMLEQLVADGADLAGVPASGPDVRGDRVMADLVLTGAELAALQADGATLLQVIQREGEGTANFEASRAQAERRHQAGMTMQTIEGRRVLADVLVVDHAYWWESKGETFLQVQVSTSATEDPDVQLTVEWVAEGGESGSFPLVRYFDAGQYMFHYHQPEPMPSAPVSLTVTSSEGGTATAEPAPWPGADVPELPEGYQQDFIDQYMTPAEISERIDRLAAQYPDLVDVVELPHDSRGYRRPAMGLVGDPATAALAVESVAYGTDGMNGTEVVIADPGAASQELSGTYEDGTLTISLATDAEGAVTSTVEEVAAYINEEFEETFRANVITDGSATMPAVESVTLDDGLDASHLNSEGQTVRMMRIGEHRDGSVPGVLAYSQEHAREWVTPLATMEFAERMLANAATDEETAELLDTVEIFVVPVVNPDGANYSFYDYNFQRKNLSNHCDGADRDPRRQDQWGVDLNRNFTVGSVHDGYVGGSENCLSGSYAGPEELSEPEAKNTAWIADTYDNITHSMNVHSYGGYFMWSPGAYKMPGREPLPMPPAEDLEMFFDASQRIIAAISQHRGTVTWPANTGPIIDTLYSAGGNSADHMYYVHDIVAYNFEVGNDLWNPETERWEGVGFQPPFEEAHPESQEYAAGLVELVKIAADAAPEREDVTRLSGGTRYETAVAIGQEAYPDSTTAVLVGGPDASMVDGLVAAPLGAALEAPVLLTNSSRLSGATADDLTDRGVTEVVVVGGEGAVSEDVVEALEAMDIEVERVSGANRYGTAVAVAEHMGADTDEVIVASGRQGNLVDALAVSGPAAATNTPVLLVRQDSVPGVTAEALEDYDSSIVVGGDGAVNDEVMGELPDPTRLSGKDRWHTATAVADHYVAEGMDSSSVAVASGIATNMVDALPGGTLGQLILLSRTAELADATTDWLEDNEETEHAYVLGGDGALSDDVVEALEGILGGR
ncbi:M14 family zinc carboxypeptidase [Ornithinimicrobium sufpigmenti]|uniref:M14 family zinc carboxypeptidase n=1 Tax=Ornithinimicrobium sufpigmenti TaxID=2508882 RepID=UPI001036AB87|nr:MULTISPECIES: M14 family zinc carboxypeptidase [unclassified Ornithinimicrobium]